MRPNPSLAAFLLGLSAACAAAENNPVRQHPAIATEASVSRIIVKFRPAATSSRVQAQAKTDVVGALARRNALSLEGSHDVVDDLHVMFVQPTDLSESSEATLAHLRADPDVEYAEIDQRRYPHAVPNDPLFTGQWYLRSAQPAAINAEAAWDITTGNSNVVVAVLDTGVRFDHPDLQRAAQAGKLLPGYDFVSADMGGTFLTANDGNARDADASDPGDWVNTTDQQNSAFADCDTGNSSWHGTRVSGLVGARTNNAEGIAGIAWGPMILPVRVLGKCGGYDSDIIAAMHWAAGEHVNGIPDNPNPAKIINLSLGAVGVCTSPYRTVVSQLGALGVLVVASAGNEDGHAVDTPANCPGVLGVAGLRHAGTKVGFSNLGPEIGISAPGGNCNNNGCQFSIDTTSDVGTTTPAGSGYTDQVHTNLGTSFSAPLVAASAALMLSVNSRLSPVQLVTRLQQSATPFPAPSGLPACVAPTTADELECACTTTTCGAGMLNTAAAVAVASKPFVIVSATPTAPSAGQAVSLRGSTSFAASDRTIASYAWTVVSSEGTAPTLTNADQANATFTAPSAGVIVLRLTITDSAGEHDFADVSVTTPTPPPTPAPTPSSATPKSGGGGGALDLPWLLMGLLALAGIRRQRSIHAGA